MKIQEPRPVSAKILNPRKCKVAGVVGAEKRRDNKVRQITQTIVKSWVLP